MTALRVDCASFEASSEVLGTDVAQSLAADAARLLAALDGCSGMAGTDPAGATWGSAYDRSASSVLSSAQALIDGAFRLAALLQQTGFNYGAAETASVPGAAPAGPDRSPWDGSTSCVGRAPSSVGSSGVGTPSGWSLVCGVVARVWPDGHQDRLHSAASAWREFGADARARSYDVTRAYAGIDAQDVPEAVDAHAACARIADDLAALARDAESVGATCDRYAGHLDDAHGAISDELDSLVDWTVGIETGGALFALVTGFTSEVAAQAAESGRIAATAARVTAIIDRLATLAGAAAEAVASVATRAAVIVDDLRPLLSVRLVVALQDTVDTARATRLAAQERLMAESGLELTQVPADAQEDVVATIDRARLGKRAFTGHDGKDFDNADGTLPLGGHYTEWTVCSRSTAHRVIFDGEPGYPHAIYYWDHAHTYVRIWP